MNDITIKHTLKHLSEHIKKIRSYRSTQYKEAKKTFDTISERFNKGSEEYQTAKEHFKKYEKFKSCTSQELLAEEIGVKRQTIIDWEKGTTCPSADNLLRLCSAFDCNMDYLFSFVDIPLVDTVSTAHFLSKIDPRIIKYGIDHEDYRDCLNYFMLPENCSSLFNETTISAWRSYQIASSLDDILNPLKDEIIKIYNEYSAFTPIQDISKATYKKYLEEKLPKKNFYIAKDTLQNGYNIKKCFSPIIYQQFIAGKEFDYSSIINYLTESTFDPLYQRGLLEAKKKILAQKFIKLLEQYLVE